MPHVTFPSSGSLGLQANQLILKIQPDEGLSLSLGAKIPGGRMRIRPVNMEFRYGTSFLSESPEAYERLILDAMRGDATLFTRNDEIEALSGIIDPILAAWHEDTELTIPRYKSGSAGPRGRSGCLVTGGGGGGCDELWQDGGTMSDDVWFERDTNPDAIDAALRDLLRKRHAANRALAPARVLNLIVIIDRAQSGALADQLGHLGRPQLLADDPVRGGRPTANARREGGG